ncbi:wax ester/triacylglycerol synthase family O-acyltransferase [Caenimonas koreensis]|uniref:WS/DGAT/MGAT family O-acyltransferase n=1 Tax=Caenimonas koreensis TaxID=367474 RepID=UPI003782E119
MNHLSGIDAAFLHLESPEMPMHVGSLNILELPPGYSGDFFEDVKKYLAERLHTADVFTRKLALMPFDLADPVWVEDDDIDLDHHIRHITLPKPGSNAQLQQYVARLHSTLLDRSRPLWEFFIIDGLRSGEVALYTKVHHARLDGQAGVALGRAILDTEPSGRRVKPPRPKLRRNDYQLGVAELLSAAATNTARQVVKLVKALPSLAAAAKTTLLPEKDENGRRNWSLPNSADFFAPRTSINVAITNQRRFAARTVPLAEVKEIAKRTGTSLNDVVMATVAGALRDYFNSHRELPEKPLLAAVPVSLRTAGDESANNQVSMVRMTLATDLPEPLQRLKRIAEASVEMKAMMGKVKSAIPTDFPMLAAPWLLSGLASLYGRSRLANVIPPIANVIISNVPGVQTQLYFAGAKIISYYPVSIPAHGMALNVTVQSYNGRLDYGLIGCRRALPDIADLADSLLAEHRKLLEVARSLEAAPAAIAAPVASAATAAPAAAKPRAPRSKAKLSVVASSKAPAAKPARKRAPRAAKAA